MLWFRDIDDDWFTVAKGPLWGKVMNNPENNEFLWYLVAYTNERGAMVASGATPSVEASKAECERQIKNRIENR